MTDKKEKPSNNIKIIKISGNRSSEMKINAEDYFFFLLCTVLLYPYFTGFRELFSIY